MDEEATVHRRKIIDQFTLQAQPFAGLPGHSESMRMLIEMSGVGITDSVLDVACGPGLVACEFAPHAAHVTGIDITPKMIELARARQAEKGQQNLSWQIGDILPLPFPDEHFSVVLTRYSFHHFLDPMAVLVEMIRVCKFGGRVLVADVVMPANKADAYNRMEVLRDPSHVKALALPEMERIIARSGLSAVQTAWYKFESELDRLLAASFPNPGDERKIRELFHEDLGINRMGICASRCGDAIEYSVPILVTVGIKTRD
jgi:ubiquinone/menaquinone biosynthesis C-methylase UbiE